MAKHKLSLGTSEDNDGAKHLDVLEVGGRILAVDLHLLKIALRKALAEGVIAHPLSSAIRKDSVFADHCRSTSAQMTETAITTVLKAFRDISLESHLENGRLELPDGYSYEINARLVAQWLIARGFNSEPEAAIEELRGLLEECPRRFWVCFGLSGIEVSGKVDMGNGMFLCDIASAPASPHLEHYSGRTPETGRLSPVDHYSQAKAVLVMERLEPVRLRHGPFQIGSLPLFPERTQMHRVIQCLPLFGPNAATVVADWRQMDEGVSIPGFDWRPRGGSAIGDLRTLRSLPFFDDPRRLEIISRFLELSDSRRMVLSVGLSRFTQAMRRDHIEDRAIELRIALEALLSSDRNHNTPISHLIRQRGGIALGTSPEDRKRFGADLSKAYDSGSIAIHTGKLRKEKEKANVEMGLQRCAELLKRFILIDPPEDWDDLVFTAQSPF